MVKLMVYYRTLSFFGFRFKKTKQNLFASLRYCQVSNRALFMMVSIQSWQSYHVLPCVPATSANGPVETQLLNIQAVPVRLGTWGQILPLMMHCLSEIEMKRNMKFFSTSTSNLIWFQQKKYKQLLGKNSG
jgi:hypothetical protein